MSDEEELDYEQLRAMVIKEKDHRGRYVLKDGEVVAEPDLLEWGKWMEAGHNRRIAHTYLGTDKKPEQFRVSTVFLGLDHSLNEGSKPLLFETMVFVEEGFSDGAKEFDMHCVRCSTFEEAQEQHVEVCDGIRDYLSFQELTE